MKKLLLFSLAILMMASCRKNSTNYPTYNEYSFVEEFSDNRNGWSFSDGANLAYGVISGGTFKIDYNDDAYPAYYVSQSLDLNTNHDFIIEAKIGSNNNMGLLFGFNDAAGAYGYSLMVDYDGNFALYDEGGNGYGSDVTEVFPLSTSSVVKGGGDWNTVRIHQKGDNWIGYINGYEVFRVAAQNMKGTGVGFVVVSNTQGEADYLEVAGYY